MPRSREKLLLDMIAAAEAIGAFTKGRDRADYDSNLMLRSAVERQFEILGEALKRLELIDNAMAVRFSEHRRIIDFRNVIAHGYDAIDSDIVWQVVQEKLPVLTAEARQLMTEITPGP